MRLTMDQASDHYRRSWAEYQAARDRLEAADREKEEAARAHEQAGTRLLRARSILAATALGCDFPIVDGAPPSIENIDHLQLATLP